MAQVTIFKDAAISIDVIDGIPPVDQTADVAALTAQVAALADSLTTRTAERDSALAKVDIARADAIARRDADAAKVDGQELLDALG